MNFIQKIRAAWKVKSFVEDGLKEAKMPTSTGKPGYKTTEFWLHLASQAGVLWGAVQGFIPPKYAALVSIVGACVYNVGQIIIKAVREVQATKQQTTTVVTTEVPVTTVTTPQ